MIPRQLLGAAWLVLCLLMVVGCGDPSDDEPAADGPVCEAGPESAGIRGRVVVPSCFSAVSQATVTVLDELQREIATASADENGNFSVPVSALAGDGVYILLAEKGPFRGPARPEPFEVSGGRSAFQLVTLATE